MSIKVKKVEMHVLNMRTRFPFKYGIASLTAVPHLFVRATMSIDGEEHIGLSSEGLPPKWFTKDPNTDFRADLADMLHVIETACGFAEQLGSAHSVFDLWQAIYVQQMRWATGEGYPPLLWSFGVSLIERAIIDGYCRATGYSFGNALRQNLLGIHLGEIHPELAGEQPDDLLPVEPCHEVSVRHTVGLADALRDSDIAEEDRCDDGLPQSLEACIRAYGLTHFKIKLSGDAEKDIERLGVVAEILEESEGEYQFTLDGNEFYRSVGPFEKLWRVLRGAEELKAFMSRLLFVEQPFHRDVALGKELGDELIGWVDRPPIIIDESDGGLNSLTDALDCGYVGTSHKNCKGVFKSVANACLLEHRHREGECEGLVLSGEDLCQVGPIAMLQDTAVAATLGVGHVERNGHHYFLGLSMYEEDVQAAVLEKHGDVYERHAQGFATLKIREGKVDVTSLLTEGFGVGIECDSRRYTPLDDWTFDSLGN